MIFGLIIIFTFLFLIFFWGEGKAFTAFFALCLIGCQFPIKGPITVEDVLIVIFFLLALSKKRIKRRIIGYPFILCVSLYVASSIISSVFTRITPHYVMALVDCLRIAVLPFLFYIYVREKENVRLIVKSMSFVAFFGIGLSLVALILQKNFYLDFLRAYLGDEFGWNYIDEIRFGFGRAQGFCLQPVSYGYICTTILSVYLLLLNKYQTKMHVTNSLMNAVALSCILGCLLSGSRSSILTMGICLICFYGKNIARLQNIIFAIIAITFIYVIYGNSIGNLWESIINSDEAGMGSSSEMRLNQWDISIYYFLQSPFIGLGTNAVHEFVGGIKNEAILGAESIWFSLLVNKGLLGCLAYISLYVFSFVHIRSLKSNALIFLSLQLLINSLTSLPGYDASIFLCMVLLAHRKEIISHRETLLSKLLERVNNM